MDYTERHIRHMGREPSGRLLTPLHELEELEAALAPLAEQDHSAQQRLTLVRRELKATRRLLGVE